MTTVEAQTILNNLCKKAEAVREVAASAKRGRQSLTGTTLYANKFHEEVLKLRKLEGDFLRIVEPAGLDATLIGDLKMTLATIRGDITDENVRTERVRHLRTIAETIFAPLLEGMNASTIPVTEQVLPMAVVADTRGYFETPIRQANGCYEHQWYDACAVMIRKFVESLIIEVYEANNREAEIKDTHGNYFMLRDLIDKMLLDPGWNLGRETKSKFPDLKTVGDRSAHNRRYFARKQDIDGILPALRLVADELLHLANLR